MKVGKRKGYILVEWPWFIRTFGQFVTGRSSGEGAAFFPVIFVASEAFTPAWLIMHERIHFRQQLELIFIGFVLLEFLERLYARFVLRKDKKARYLYAATEQEAYLNMHDSTYLERRSFGSVWHYVRHKRDFTLMGPGQLRFTDDTDAV